MYSWKLSNILQMVSPIKAISSYDNGKIFDYKNHRVLCRYVRITFQLTLHILFLEYSKNLTVL